MLSLLKTVLILCVLFLQLSSSAVIRRHGPHGLHYLPRPNTAPKGLSTTFWRPTSPGEQDGLPDHDWRNSEDDDSPDEDDEGDDEGDEEDVDDDGGDEDDEDGDEDDGDEEQSHPAAPKPTALNSIAVLPPTSTKGLSAIPKSTTLNPIAVLPPTTTNGIPAAPNPTTLNPTPVLPPTSTKEIPVPPKYTTLSTVTIVPVPKTSSVAIQPIASTLGAKPSSTIGSQPVASSLGAKTVWQPTAGTTWQIELSGTVSDLTHPADVFDVDLFDTPASTIKTLKDNGKRVICYFSAGSFEDWRPDKASFQASDKGSPLQGWPGEFWLDTKSPNVRSIMTSRIKMAQDKGCDGVDPDNVDGYDNSNGLGLSQATAIDYMKYMADEAHSRGLSIGLKNAGGIVGDVLPIMEWHVNEQCLQYGECDKFMPFIHQNKPVFHIEYPDGAPNITPDVKTKNCNAPSAKGFSTVLKTMDLDAWVDPCA